jgi:type IV secretion system protein VirB9
MIFMVAQSIEATAETGSKTQLKEFIGSGATQIIARNAAMLRVLENIEARSIEEDRGGKTGPWARNLVTFAKLLGEEILGPLLDPKVCEIMLNPNGDLYVEELGNPASLENPVGFIRPGRGEAIIRSVAGLLDKVVTSADPLIEGKLPLDGSRFAGQLPPNVDGPTFSIRKRAVMVFTLDDYIRQGVMTERQALPALPSSADYAALDDVPPWNPDEMLPPKKIAEIEERKRREQQYAPGDFELMDDLFFSTESVQLTEKEKRALLHTRAWQSGRIIREAPVVNPDGAVEFIYGAEMPSIVCSVMQVTDLEFQPGERINDPNGVFLGDSTRWRVQAAISGGDIEHLIVKPMDVGLDTSMIVTTNRRTYHLRLRSHRTEFMPRVRFTYPDEAELKWDAIRTAKAEERERETIPETNEYLGDLDFGYSIQGNAPWKPIRVYNDSVKTIIEMPAAMKQTEAPTLLVVRKEGRLFKKQEQVIVNYRVQNGRYIVDTIFDKAVMIVGVGGNQTRVTITKSRKVGK